MNDTPLSRTEPVVPDNTRALRAPVSVVIPCFNSGVDVYRALLSVWSQSWPPAQVVVVDDGSDDPKTLAVLAALSGVFDARLSIEHSPKNLGPSAARNLGWELSSQPFIAFLDADDVWHHQKLESQLPLMLSDHGPEISGHPFTVFPDIGGPEHDGPQPTARLVTFFGALFLNPFSTPSVIVRRDLTERFDTTKRFSEDYDLWLRILHNHGSGTKLSTPLCTLFKPPVGDSGLSSRILKMEAGQVSVYKDLRKKNYLSWHLYVVVRAWAIVRFARRLILVGLRRQTRRPRGSRLPMSG